MKCFTTVFISLLFINLNWALPTGEVILVKGEAFYGNEKIIKGTKIIDGGLVTTTKGSIVKIKIQEWGSTLTLGPKSKLKVNLSSQNVKKNYLITAGASRWRSIINSKAKIKGKLYSPIAALGVRGTDFLFIVNPLLGESEIVVLDGLVVMENLNRGNDQALIKKGQWGGLGGRYGTRIGEVLNLPKKVLNHFNEQLND
jgi:hypothetical protein